MNIALNDARAGALAAPPNVWQPALVSTDPGVALSIRSRDRQRVVILESPAAGRGGTTFREQALRRCLGNTPVEAADALLGRSGGRRLCTGVAVADLRADGRVDLCVVNAPPAVLLSPDAVAVSVSGPGDDAVTCTLALGDVLLLCSATFLEEPPRVMSSLRDEALGAAGLRRLRQALQSPPEAGAVATLAWTAWVRRPSFVADAPAGLRGKGRGRVPA
jgi:hypothetical protein